MTGQEALEKMGLSEASKLMPLNKGKKIVYQEIRNKDHKRYGVVYSGNVMKGHKAEVIPGKSIRLYGQEHNRVNGPVSYDITFKLGDWAEYDSYNLKYTGKIIAIGPKTVTIQAYPGSNNARNHKLNLYQFSFRNWDYDGKKIADHNAEEMMYI